MNARNHQKAKKTIRLLAAALVVGLLLTIPIQPTLAKGYVWQIEVHGKAQDYGIIYLRFAIFDTSDPVEAVLVIVAVRQGDSATAIRDKIVAAINKTPQLTAWVVTTIPNCLRVTVKDSYMGTENLTIKSIKEWDDVPGIDIYKILDP